MCSSFLACSGVTDPAIKRSVVIRPRTCSMTEKAFAGLLKCCAIKQKCWTYNSLEALMRAVLSKTPDKLATEESTKAAARS